MVEAKIEGTGRGWVETKREWHSRGVSVKCFREVMQKGRDTTDSQPSFIFLFAMSLTCPHFGTLV